MKKSVGQVNIKMTLKISLSIRDIFEHFANIENVDLENFEQT